MNITQAALTPVEIEAGEEKFLIGHQTIGDTGEIVQWVRKQIIEESIVSDTPRSSRELEAAHELAWKTASKIDQSHPIYSSTIKTIQGHAKLLQVLCNRATPDKRIDYETAYNRIQVMSDMQLLEFYKVYRAMMESKNPTTPEHPTEPTNG